MVLALIAELTLTLSTIFPQLLLLVLGQLLVFLGFVVAQLNSSSATCNWKVGATAPSTLGRPHRRNFSLGHMLPF